MAERTTPRTHAFRHTPLITPEDLARGAWPSRDLRTPFVIARWWQLDLGNPYGPHGVSIRGRAGPSDAIFSPAQFALMCESMRYGLSLHAWHGRAASLRPNRQCSWVLYDPRKPDAYVCRVASIWGSGVDIVAHFRDRLLPSLAYRARVHGKLTTDQAQDYTNNLLALCSLIATGASFQSIINRKMEAHS